MIHTTREHRIGDNVELMRAMPADSIDTIITSPPYWGLRDYGVDGQIGLEPTLKEYHDRMMEVTAECMRVLKPTGVMFWNHGDSYGGSGGSGGDYNDGGLREGQPKVGKSGGSAKCMTMQNERLIIKMIDDQGWILRNRIIWNKPNGMPSSVTDRFSNKYEPVYMLTKNKNYWFDLDAVRVPHAETSLKRWKPGTKRVETTATVKNAVVKKINPTYITAKSGDLLNSLGKNPGDVWDIKSPEDDLKQLLEVASELVGTETAIAIFESYMESRGICSDIWTIPTQPYPDSHFATFPIALIEPMIKAACPEGGTVLDPFAGSGTVGEVARNLNRNAILLELNPEYGELIAKRTMANTPPLTAYFGGECP